MWTRVLTAAILAALGAPLLVAGCALDVAETCMPDSFRCSGDVLEYCAGHPGGLTGEAPEDVHYEHGSPATWETVMDCGAERCVTPPDGGKPFCAP